jgi:exosome complex component CSL4
MDAHLPAVAVPGQSLAAAALYIPGPGTHVQNSLICASIAGPVVVKELESRQGERATLIVARSYSQRSHAICDRVTNTAVVEGSRPVNGTSAGDSGQTIGTPTGKQKAKKNQLKFNTLPTVDSTVLARVTRVQKRQATVSILVVLDENRHLDDEDINAVLASSPITTNADNNNADELRFQALIRKEDVRAVEKDSVVLDDMFRVGDIVRAIVISLGDQSFYYCSTARNDLGVVMARSEAGNMMFPVSWKEMRDSVTGIGEARKVARPF